MARPKKIKDVAQAEQPQEVKTEHVKMVRDPEQFNAPHTALVHPNEVENYQLGGWVHAD
jgi:hypothetical protein